MSWSQSLIKLSSYEVEVLQKRMADIGSRQADAELRLVMLDAEGEAEAANAGLSAEAGWYHIGFLDGLRLRKGKIRDELQAIALEAAAARELLGEAFETQKKYEQVAETARLLEVKELGRRETAALDELGLRRAAG